VHSIGAGTALVQRGRHDSQSPPYKERTAMVIAADYPFMDVLWTMIIFFCWVIWIWMVVALFSDIFRRRDIGGFAKAAWIVFMIVLPFIGVLVYLIAQHDKIAERNLERAQGMQREVDEHIKTVAGGSASEIEKAVELRDTGAITESEFQQLKTRALAAR